MTSVKLLLILAISVSTSDACDYTFYLKSSNKLCKDKHCNELMHGLITLKNGQESCFINDDGTTDILKLHSLSKIIRYEKIYKACEPNVKIVQDSMCWHSKACNNDDCHPHTYEKHRFQDVKGNTSDSIYTGCMIQGLCGDTCFFGNSHRCLYGLVEVYPKNCKQVYKLESYTWEAHILRSQGVTVTDIIVRGDSPTFFEPFKGLVISVSENAIEPIGSTVVELTDSTFIDIEVSPIGQPIKGLVGDYQLSDDGSTTYDMNNIVCKSTMCSLVCDTQSPMDQLAKYFKYPDSTFTGVNSAEGGLIRRKPMSGIVNVVTVMNASDTLKLDTPTCDITNTYAYACTGCSLPSSVGFVASDIKQTGIMQFNSNCSFSQDYLMCQKTKYELKVVGSPEYCSLSFVDEKPRNLNYTFVIKIEYTFTGQLYKLNYIQSSSNNVQDIQSSLTNLATSPSFVNGVYVSAGLSAISLLVFKIIIRSLTYKMTARELDTAKPV